MQLSEATEIYKIIKHKPTEYDETIHCPLILQIMSNKDQASFQSFCSEIKISDTTFYRWLNLYPLLKECYDIGKMYAFKNWQIEGEDLADRIMMPGETSYRFEHWRMMGWCKFGVGRNSKIRLKLEPDANPNEHYKQLIKQAMEGDFTSSEFKQLMESINVGLRTHEVFKLQQEIDDLRKDLATMVENSNGDNKVTAK